MTRSAALIAARAESSRRGGLPFLLSMTCGDWSYRILDGSKPYPDESRLMELNELAGERSRGDFA